MGGGDTDDVGFLDGIPRDGCKAVGVLLFDDPFLPFISDNVDGGLLLDDEISVWGMLS